MSMTYRGSVEIIDRDAETHRAVMSAKAKETRGQGTADARVQMQLMPDDRATLGTINADVQLSGKAAAMGRGIINDVSARIVETFSRNLAAMLAERPGELAEPSPAAEAACGRAGGGRRGALAAPACAATPNAGRPAGERRAPDREDRRPRAAHAAARPARP